MYSKFENLDEDKRQRILNAALKEFAAKGYDHASTNRIVEEAGIAKGLLFHYFKSKKQLFLYLYDYSLGLFISEVRAKMDPAERDIMVKICQGQRIKLELIGKYPGMFDFLISAYKEESPAVKDELDGRNRGLFTENMAKLMNNIDVSKFKEGIDARTAINIIVWTFEGFGNSKLSKIPGHAPASLDIDAAFADADIYVRLLKQSLYKPE